MPFNPENTKPLHFVLPIEGYAALKALAAQQRRPMADVVREAIEVYMRKAGVQVSLAVERGGDRATPEG